jgi:hypothetical protein
MSYKKEKKEKFLNVSTFFKQPTITNNMHFFQDSSFHDHPRLAWMNLLQKNSLKPYYSITLFLHHEFYEWTKNVCKNAQYNLFLQIEHIWFVVVDTKHILDFVTSLKN